MTSARFQAGFTGRAICVSGEAFRSLAAGESAASKIVFVPGQD